MEGNIRHYCTPAARGEGKKPGAGRWVLVHPPPEQGSSFYFYS